MGAPNYKAEEDQALREAVSAGACRDRDFRPLAARLGRPAHGLRQRALKLGLIQPAERAGAPVTPWSEAEIGFLRKARARKTPLYLIAKTLGRSRSAVERQAGVLEGRAVRSSPREIVRVRDPALDFQAKACERHAAACLAAGGFWALSERRLGRDQVAVCLPLIPPVQMRGAPR